MSLKNKITERFIGYMNSTSSGRWIPYAFGSRILGNYCQTEYAQKRNFKRKSRIFKAFLEELDITENQDQLLLEKNTIGFHKNWRGAAFSHLKNSKIDSFIDLKNYDKFLNYYKEGKGIILVGSHYGMAEISLSLFPLKGYDNFYTIVGDGGAETMKFQALNRSINSRQLIFSNESNTRMIKALFEARNILNEGGIIHVLGDGHQGNSNLTLPFLNKMRGYRASFAELGLSTSAHIIPILISMDMNGRFTIRFMDPLDKGDEAMNREDRIISIVKQYAGILEKAWMKEPQQVNWGHIKTYLQYVNKE